MLKASLEVYDRHPHITKGAQALRTVFVEGANTSVSMDALQFIMTCSWGENGNGEAVYDVARLSEPTIST